MSVQRVLRDLNKLNTFVRVAERRSFTRAAEDLRTTPSVISKHVKELEDALGFTVLNRSTHGVSLTETGEGLLQACLEMLDQIDGFVTSARTSQNLAHGTLRLQTVGEYAALIGAPVVSTFLSRTPSMKLHHIATYDPSQGVDEGADVVLSTKRLSAPGLREIELGAVKHVICASPAYLKENGRPDEPRALREHNCIADLRSPSKEWPFLVDGHSLLVEIGGRLLSNGHLLTCRAALDGLGIVRVPERLVQSEIAGGRLVPLLQDTAFSPERLLAYASGGTLPKKTTEFLSDLRASFKR